MSEEQFRIRTVNVTRYVTPLREGGSLPAIVEADDDGLYVLKFRGAGQGLKALIAELISGEIARTLDRQQPLADGHPRPGAQSARRGKGQFTARQAPKEPFRRVGEALPLGLRRGRFR